MTIDKPMQDGIKDMIAVTIAEMYGDESTEHVNKVRSWLDTVETAEDFFGGMRTEGYKEYNAMINAREKEYEKARKRRLQSA